MRRRPRRPPFHVLGFCLALLSTPCRPAVRYVEQRELAALSASSVLALADSPHPTTNLDPSNPNSHLANILIPRAPDTENNTLVRNYLASTLRALDWHIEEDPFVADTPEGPKHFTNLIATKDPEAPRRIALAAHFDSKFFATYPMNQFVGATDSAAPCALILDLAQTLDPLLTARAARLAAAATAAADDDDPFSSLDDLDDDDAAAHTTLQLIFFDGEEAFHDWTDRDSIYGARHLAAAWDARFLPPHPRRRLAGPGAPHTPLSALDHLVLLDLLGAPRPRVRSYYPETGWLFDALGRAERALRDAGLLGEDGHGAGTDGSFFVERAGAQHVLGYIGDDHKPFLDRGVNVLHVITEPFPDVWHRLSDDASALDLPTLRRWNLIFRVFFAEYLGLRPEEAQRRDPAPSTSEGAAHEVRRSDSELGR